eukprot:gnl/MRDRNA2_/MRDRNA2_88191_c0_seq1.p1 gnl/MRDRNA2_/MRDRNA2_88191_c0~~gnl/MRDRNA2_/MRDRNA2_88191_c0_seq1.p1  ORF type:complete len:237 (+),score=38.72 gnl/MRDRNA2_/MRDRNA2_88191_c0_seq1:66-776(+)
MSCSAPFSCSPMSCIFDAEEQETWLQEQGCRVRGTFIEYVEPDVQRRSHRRVQSVPPSFTFYHQLPATQNVEERVHISLFRSLPDQHPCKESNASTADCKSPRSESDSISTVCSENERKILPGVASPEHLRDQAEKLAQLISKECCYLRIENHRLLVAADLQQDGLLPAKRNVAASLCIFVNGLPWTKRAKWRQPLLRSAATALQGLSADAVVVGGNLFVNIPSAGRIQVDFAAAR